MNILYFFILCVLKIKFSILYLSSDFYCESNILYGPSDKGYTVCFRPFDKSISIGKGDVANYSYIAYNEDGSTSIWSYSGSMENRIKWRAECPGGGVNFTWNNMIDSHGLEFFNFNVSGYELNIQCKLGYFEENVLSFDYSLYLFNKDKDNYIQLTTKNQYTTGFSIDLIKTTRVNNQLSGGDVQYFFDYNEVSPPRYAAAYSIVYGVYYYQKLSLDIGTYSISKQCAVINDKTEIVINVKTKYTSLYSAVIRLKSTTFLRSFSVYYPSSTEYNANYIITNNAIPVGTYDTKLYLYAEHPMYNDKIEIINNYTVTGISPVETFMPYVSFNFYYPNDQTNYVSFKLKQDALYVSHIGNCARDSAKYVLTCHFNSNFKKLKEGEVSIFESYRTCEGTKTEDIYFTLQLRFAHLDEVKFDITITKPTLVGKNRIKIKTEYYYNLALITEIKFNVIDYLGTQREEIFTKAQIVYDASLDEISLDIMYVTGDLIELVSFTDSNNESISFTHLEYNIGYDTPLVFTCPPIIALSTYTCSIMLAEWGKADYDISTITEIDLVGPTTKKYYTSDSTIKKDDNDILTVNVTLSSNSVYSFMKIISSDGALSKSYSSSVANYPKFQIYSDLTIITNELQIAYSSSFISAFTFPSDSFLFVLDKLVTNCNGITCKIDLDSNDSQTITNFKLLRNNIYYPIDISITLNIYEISKQCLNSIDTEPIVITISSSDLLEGYELYLNGELNPIAGQPITEYQYSYSLSLSQLANGEYTSMNLKKDDKDYVLSNSLIFYYVDNAIDTITGSLHGGYSAQQLVYTFTSDVTHIKTVVLQDEDNDSIVEATECVIGNTNELICTYDMSDYFGYKYKVVFISECEDIHYMTEHVIETLLDEQGISFDREMYVKDEIFFTVTPNIRTTVNYIKLTEVNEGSIILINDFQVENKNIVKFKLDSIGVFNIETEIDQKVIVDSTQITIINNAISLLKDKLILPIDSDFVISTVYIPLVEPIVKEQIEYVHYEEIDLLSIYVSIEENNIKVYTHNKLPYSEKQDHVITLKDRSQNEILTFTISLAAKPLLILSQSLFIKDSNSKELTVLIEGLVIDHLYLVDDAYLPFTKTNETSYTMNIEVSSTKDFPLSIKVDHYYYATEYFITVINEEYDTLFRPLPLCQFLYAHQHTIDLTLRMPTIIDENDITPFLYDAKQTEISLTKEGTSFIYSISYVDYGEHTLNFFYKRDPFPFFTKVFNITSFDQTRTAFNLNSTEFFFDFRNMICDINLNQLLLPYSSQNVLANCAYTPYRLICSLNNETEKSLLPIGNKSLLCIDTTWFFDITLLGCVKPTDRVDSVTRECLLTCRANGDRVLEYKKECVHECPLGSNNFNGFCMENVTIVSTEEDAVRIEGSFEELEAIFMDNLEAFVELGKTIITDELVLQIYNTDNSLTKDGVSQVDFAECEDSIRS